MSQLGIHRASYNFLFHFYLCEEEPFSGSSLAAVQLYTLSNFNSVVMFN